MQRKRIGPFSLFRVELRPGTGTGARALGASALGALAVGATAAGAIAIGKLAIKRAAIERLAIEELTVGHLRVRELEIVREHEPESASGASAGEPAPGASTGGVGAA